MTMDSDERSNERTPLEIPVVYICGDELGSGKAVDLSIRGLLIEGDYSPALETRLRLMLFLPGLEPLYITRAVVRWRSPDQFGVEFLALPESFLKQLSSFLSGVRHGRELVWPWERDSDQGA